MSSVVASFVILAALLAGPALAEGLPQVHDGLSAPAQAWGKAMEAGDLAALARMHGPDTIAYPPDATKRVGATAIMKDYAGLLAKYSVRVKTDDAHWMQSGPLVVSWGQTTLTLHPKAGGADVVSRTRFTDAARATPEGWRYVVDHASMPK